MTTYKNTNYETAEELRNALNTELATLAYPYSVKHKIYGEGQLTFIKAPLLGGSLYATIDFAVGTKTLAVDVVLASNLLEMPEDLMEVLLETQTVFKEDFETRQQAQRIADRQAREEAEAASKKAIADKKAEEAYQKAKNKAIKDFETLADAVVPRSTVDEFYYSLGYIAKHAGTVSAALPDYLEDAFKKYFGSEAPCRIVDSKKKGPAGYTSQWTWSFGISLKKPETVPAFLQDKLNPAGKSITDTSFVWDLVDNYGFQFGKKQDIEKIRSHVPAQHISFFEAGLA
jgi:hypothetical protein